MHWVAPAAHTPGFPVLQATPPPGLPSSATPLQSSSRPLQVSALGGWFCTQRRPPLAHAVVPAAQAPRLPVLQA